MIRYIYVKIELKDDAVLRKQMSEYSLSRREEYSIQGIAKRILY